MTKYSRRKWLGSATLASSALLFNLGAICANEAIVSGPTALRLNANENPYGPSPKVLVALQKSLSGSNRYPFQQAEALVEQLARYHNLPSSHFMLGAGSTQLLKLLAQWALMNQYHVSYAAPTFDILPKYVARFGGHTTKTQLTTGKVHDLNALEEASRKHPGIVYVVNPNNPTGTSVNRNDLIRFCKQVSSHSYVVLDEAYIEYLGDENSLKDLIRDNPRIIIVRTFSKIYGLAGLRVGYLMAHPDTISTLSALEIWPNSGLGLPGIMAASASLSDSQFVASSRRQNQACLDYTREQLEALDIASIPSATNFLYFDSSGHTGDFNTEMSAHSVLVRELEDSGKTWVRVSMGTMEDMQRFISIIKKVWS